MSLFDLKPLGDETIEELGLEPYELWLLKVGEETFGPYETLSLRHYASDNKPDFEGVFATHLDHEEWKFLTDLPEFKDIFAEPAPEGVKGEWYWILRQGSLTQALTYDDIERHIDLGTLSLTDAISTDHGDTWNKVFHLKEFAHKLHTSVELPQCPKDSQFLSAKIRVMEKIDAKALAGARDNTAGLAFLGQKTTQIVVLKVDEIDIESLQETEISRSLKWAIPSMGVGMIALVMSGYFFFGSPDESMLITDNDFQLKRSISGSRSGLLEDSSKTRRPSSMRSFRSGRSGLTNNSYQESSFPTHIETHQPDDPQSEPLFDEQPQAPQTEESLVQNGEQSLDAAMNGVSQPAEQPLEQPQVEEVSDF